MKISLITPSYCGDLERCELLCRSVDRLASTELEHVLIVDRRDVGPFQRLAGPRRRLLVVEEMLPWWIQRTPLSQKWWASFRTWPIRNWILQQIVKLSVCHCVDSDAHVFVDSDAMLVRPIGPETFVRGDQLALFRVPGQYEVAKSWHRTSARLLGLPESEFFGSNYVGNLITWRRDNLCRLLAHIERVTGQSWVRAVASQLHFSEYTLYGIYVEHILGGDCGHFWDTRKLCHAVWHGPWGSDQEIDAIFHSCDEDCVAVMISSKIGVPPERYAGRWEESVGLLAAP